MHKHLKTHGTSVVKRQSQHGLADTQQPSKRIYDLLPKLDSTQVVISRLVALDGIPMATLVTSKDMRRFFSKDGLTVYKSATSIRSGIMKYYDEVVARYSKEMIDGLENGSKYSIILDEWTSNRNRRFMNVNVHGQGGKVWGLGLTRVYGSANAERCQSIVEDTLSKFQLSLNNINSATTDGAAVMVKMGKSLNRADVLHQLCFAHGLHLAVCDVLYKKKKAVPIIVEDETSNDIKDGEEDWQGLFMVNLQDDIEELTDDENISALISKVWKTVSTFNYSPCKNDEIFSYFRPESQKEKSLILDCKTRWNSLVEMVERFVEMQETIQKSVPHLKDDKITFSESEFDKLRSILKCLKPVQIAATSICSRDSTLLTADCAFSFCLKTIRKEHGVRPTIAPSSSKSNHRAANGGLRNIASSPLPRGQ